MYRHLSRGYTDVVDADLSRYFDGSSFGSLKDESSRILAAAQTLGRKIEFLEAPANLDIDAAFATLIQLQAHSSSASLPICLSQSARL
jgi:hypothetical protein